MKSVTPKAKLPTHWYGYLVGLVAVVVSAVSAHFNLPKDLAPIFAAGGFGTFGLTVVFKILSELGISKAQIEADAEKAWRDIQADVNKLSAADRAILTAIVQQILAEAGYKVGTANSLPEAKPLTGSTAAAAVHSANP